MRVAGIPLGVRDCFKRNLITVWKICPFNDSKRIRHRTKVEAYDPVFTRAGDQRSLRTHDAAGAANGGRSLGDKT